MEVRHRQGILLLSCLLYVTAVVLPRATALTESDRAAYLTEEDEAWLRHEYPEVVYEKPDPPDHPHHIHRASEHKAHNPNGAHPGAWDLIVAFREVQARTKAFFMAIAERRKERGDAKGYKSMEEFTDWFNLVGWSKSFPDLVGDIQHRGFMDTAYDYLTELLDPVPSGTNWFEAKMSVIARCMSSIGHEIVHDAAHHTGLGLHEFMVDLVTEVSHPDFEADLLATAWPGREELPPPVHHLVGMMRSYRKKLVRDTHEEL